MIAALLLSLFAAQHPAPAGEPAAPAFELSLRTNVLARGLDVTIGDLVDISPAGADATLIGAVRFGPAPVPGYARTVTRSEALQSLCSNGFAAASFRWKGAAEALVQAVVVPVAQAEVLDAAVTALQATLQVEGGDVEFEPQSIVRTIQAAPGRRSQELRARVRGGATAGSSALVDVDVLVDDEVAKTIPVQFRLARFHNVLKVTATVRQGAPLGPDNLVLSREKLAQTQGLYLTAFDQVAGMISKRNLQPNQLLTLADVGEPALIRRGELVTLVSTRGRVKVVTKAIANHDAARGEPVTVTNAQSRAQVTGVAEAVGTVVVRN